MGFLIWISRPTPQVVSALGLCACAILGIIYCIRISRRKASTKAALSLAAPLAAWLLISAGFAALGERPSPLPLIIVCLVIFTAILIGLFLVILAFMELRRDLLPSSANRLMIISSLVLGALAMGAVGIGVYQVISPLLNPDNGARGPVAITAIAPAAAPATQPSAAQAAATSQPAVIGDAAPPRRYGFRYPPQAAVVEASNFILESPGDTWLRTPNAPEGQAGFGRVFPFMNLAVTGIPYGDDITTEILADDSLINTNPDLTEFQMLERRPLMLNGLQGVVFKKRYTYQGQSRFRVHWVCAYRGYLYEVMLFGNADDEAKITEAAPDLFKRFHILDPDRIVRAPAAIPLHWESSEFAYKYHLELPRWRQVPDVATVVAGADFGATSPHSHIAISPVYLYGTNPGMEELTDALLYPRPLTVATAASLQKSKEGDVEIYTLESQQTSPTRVFFSYKCIRRGELAYLIVGKTDAESRKGELKAAMDGFVLQPVPAKLSPLEFTVTARRAHSIILNNLGLRYGEDIDRAAPCFRKALDINPDPVILENLANAYINRKEYQKAILTINRDIDNFRDTTRLRALLALARGLNGEKQDAINLYREVFATDFEDDAALDYYLNLLVGSGNPGEAIAAAEKYLKRINSLTIAIRLAQLNSDIGQHARAIEILEQRQKGIPFNPKIAYAMADASLLASKWEDALGTIKKLRDAGQDAAYLDQLQGRAEFGLRRYREAKTSFEASLKKDPHLADSSEWLKHVTTILGQGDTSNTRDPIDAVAIPAELLKDFSAPPPAASKEASAYLAHRIIALSFIPGREQRETRYTLIKALDTNGVETFSTEEIDFDPLTESIYVNKLIVRDGDGKIVAQGKNEDNYTVDQGGEIASQQKRLHVPVPGLKPGYTVEMVVTRRDHAAPKEPRYKECLLSGNNPCIQAAIVLKGDPALFKIRASEGLTEKKIEGGLCWTMAEPPPIRFENLSPPYMEIAPRVDFCDRNATWPTEAREYLSTLTARLIPSDGTKALAQRLTQGITGDEEKASAILKHVQKELTYKAIAFGPRARMPQSVDEIVQKRYGDCKDHSLLLHHLLNAAGLQSQLALAKSYGQIITDEPSLDQFDHMIVYCAALDRFFDCTSKNLDLCRFTPLALGGSHVLVLEPLQPRLVQIPRPAESNLDLTRQLSLLDSGELAVHDTARITGYLAAGFRAYFRGIEPRLRTEYMQRVVSTPGRDAGKPDLKIENLEEVDRPLLVDFSYVIANGFKKNGVQLVGDLPAPWDRYYLESQPLEKRETPFEFLAPVAAKTDLTINLPEHYRLRALPNDFASSDDFASAKAAFTQSGQSISMKSSWRQIPGRHPAARYQNYHKSMSNMLGAFEPTLILEK